MKPMLAAATDGTNLTYPVLASPKLDGIRCLVVNGVAVSRSFKPIPNKYVQKLIGSHDLNGLDGELIVGDMTAENVFNVTTSGVMSRDGEPDVKFYVFDDLSDPKLEFKSRIINAAARCAKYKDKCIAVGHVIIDDEDKLLKAETNVLNMGYEGLMIRDPKGQYKYGRSTLKQGWLLKLKRFLDSDAKILGLEELMHNTNEAKKNELGHIERSHKKAGMVGKDMLGALYVQDLKTGVKFKIGTGFDEKQRKFLWKQKKQLIGQVVKYKYQPTGVKEAPRFPVFLSFRDIRDL